MNAEQKQQIEQALRDWETDSSDMFSYEETCEVFAALLQELVDAPEPKSCGWIRAIDEAMVTHHLGVADIADDYEAAKKKLNTLLCLNQDIGEYFSAKAPTPSVPDGLPLLISGAIYDFAGFLTTQEKTIQVGARVDASAVVDMLKEWAALRGLKLDDAAVLSWQEWLSPTPPEPPADVARDAEPVAYVTGVYGGHTTVAPIDAAQVLRVGMALYTAPPAPDQSEQHLGMVPADVAGTTAGKQLKRR